MVAHQDGIKRLLGGEEKPCTPLLMATLDALNARFGRGTVRLGSAALVNGRASTLAGTGAVAVRRIHDATEGVAMVS